LTTDAKEKKLKVLKMFASFESSQGLTQVASDLRMGI
jgi:hypothetical protein